MKFPLNGIFLLEYIMQEIYVCRSSSLSNAPQNALAHKQQPEYQFEAKWHQQQ
jgi:hypothetical protein